MSKWMPEDAAFISRTRMSERLTLADQYLLMGLKLKEDGRVRCMFCHVYAKAMAGEQQGVKVVHRPECIAARMLDAQEVPDGE